MTAAFEGVAGLARRVEGLAKWMDRMTDRLDQLASAIIRGRTRDVGRIDDHERRLRSLERPRRRRS